MVTFSTTEAPCDREVYSSARVTIGAFRARPGDPLFREARCTRAAVWVFPRIPVRIRQQGRDGIIADSNHVILYNRDQEYDRSKLCDAGDRCEWFAAPESMIADAIRRFDPDVDQRGGDLFPFGDAPADARTYAAQRSLFHHVDASPEPDAMLVEEATAAILDRVVALAFEARGRKPGAGARRASTRRSRAESVLMARAILATRFDEPWTLETLGEEVAASPFHLARLFRAATGRTVHAYLTDARLRAALGLMEEPRLGLTEIALAVGFSSHAHFTTAFRKAFGAAPSTIRGRAAAGDLREMSTILKAKNDRLVA
ncbi:MAG: helix-turn-helix transcriptional regulator [Planctomycetota bacterium]|nr:helix-turn-helix transcriptional regulator [Planctomycetota bacterium]